MENRKRKLGQVQEVINRSVYALALFLHVRPWTTKWAQMRPKRGTLRTRPADAPPEFEVQDAERSNFPTPLPSPSVSALGARVTHPKPQDDGFRNLGYIVTSVR